MAKDQVMLMPEAELEPREGDIELSSDQLGQLSLFTQLKGKGGFEKFPGTIRIRHYLTGDAICRQGEPGWTAFYILTSADVENVIRAVAPGAGTTKPSPGVPVYRRTMDDILLLPTDAEAEICATIYLAVPRRPEPPSRGIAGWKMFGGKTAAKPRARPKFIPIDAPTDIDTETLQAFLREGELFGEMSCLNRTPRSATIIAARDCYVVEMLRNIFEKIKEDANYKKKVEEEYKRRALDQQLRNLPLLTDLTAPQIELVRKHATVRTYKAGQIICDENDRSDDVYLIRSGLVKIVKGDTALLSVRDLVDLNAVVAALNQTGAPTAKIVAAFPPDVKSALSLDPPRMTAAGEQSLVYAINQAIKGPPLWTDAAFKELAATPEFQADVKRLPASAKEWAERDIRRLNRLIIELAVPGLRSFRRAGEGPETILAYRARGELIGEIGLLRGRPRGASCVAYIHARDEFARKEAAKRDLEAVELVQLPSELFTELLQDPAFARKVDSILAERVASDKEVMATPVSDTGMAARQSERFEELGLIQGQRLMLIDLERCTRCDECVQACVASHDDGRSRLFLDGPRFGQYLVPTTCRSCLDPVCMIGCPVGSIHRGDNGQIVIEDWCIGCQMCAKQCPYGSIQMYDMGVIPEGAYGWHFRPADRTPDTAWTTTRYNLRRHSSGPRAWRASKAPFSINRDLLGGQAPAFKYDFRYEFSLAGGEMGEGDEFKVEVTAPAACEEVLVWMDGKPLDAAEMKKDKRTYPVSDGAKSLKPGKHVVGVRVTPPEGHTGPIFDLRGDIVRRPKAAQLSAAEYIEKGVIQTAVVCDLCSDLPGKKPACVRACPHDAAMRVDARRNFPSS